jgi:hypothetical protein
MTCRIPAARAAPVSVALNSETKAANKNSAVMSTEPI